MTATDLPPYDPSYDEPDPTVPAPSRARAGIPYHDTQAEEAVVGVMLYSLDACDTVIEAGVHPEDFYVPFNKAAYAAIVSALEHGDVPDIITVGAVLGADFDIIDTRRRLVTITAAAHITTHAAGVYARRILHCARARRIQGAATEVARAAGTGDLQNALVRLAELQDAVPVDDVTTTWAPVDLQAVLDSDGPPPPTMLARDDDVRLLYAGKVHAFNAESESGKSWLAQWACAERLLEDEHVVYLDFEDDAADVTARLQALGVTREQLLNGFHYLRPDDPIDTVAIATLERILVDHQPTLAIIDGVTEVMVQNGWSITDNDDAARFLLELPRRIARHGCAVVMIDHVPKDKDQRGRYGIGAQHKLAGINGAAYTLEVTRPFGRGRSGTARLLVTKDRPGHVRGVAVDGRFAAEIRVNSLPDGDVHIQIAAHTDAPTETVIRPTTLMERVSQAVEDLNAAGIEPTKNQVLTDVPGKRTFVIEALKRLVTEGWIAVTPGPNRAQLHRTNRPYRAVDDPKSEAYQPPDEPPSDYDPEEL